MTLKEVISKSNFNDVYGYLISSYEKKKIPDKEKIREGYNQIKMLKPSKLDKKMIIIIDIIEEDGEKYYSVSGIYENEEELYALEFEKWGNWLSYEIESDIFNVLNYSEIVAHCFWEMTWLGWTIEDCKKQIEIETKESKIEEQLEMESEKFINKNCIITDRYFNKLLKEYSEAETDNLKVSIEIIIEEIINNNLVSKHHINIINQSFEDEDIKLAIKKNFFSKSEQ